ncbi:5'/3'-nucleotidase SurE [Psychrobacter sp. AOP22-C1-22]|uniref:5'/3'-nucleotidase SurE n=1 Tax=unclassified Psychrobacter TaxID=196806 RepID=UPI001787B90F|nr:5'/3'-nucleotidase SurE [Psychrobacter sp. FME6]MBE0407146.1 5'/3'-nucleotidase SurE [Psychrobacter sp. FME6]
MKFLISNDDGVNAPGLLALSQALSSIGDVVVVAPNDEQSGCASALSVSKPLHTQQLPSGAIAVNGSPADCIYLALHELYRQTRFDCVITGINSGANLGQDVMFSGTFGAALTAQLFGIPAIATSLVGGGVKGKGQEQVSDYQMAANEIAKLFTETPILDAVKNLPYHVLNVNIPNVDNTDDIKGRKITALGHSQIARPVHHMVDPRGRDAYWLSLRKRQNEVLKDKVPEPWPPHQKTPEQMTGFLTTKMTDDQAVAAGYISLSPVRLHHTPAAALETLSALAL